MSADQDFTKLCAKYRERIETNWERLFGTPERTLQTIVDGCTCDCYACSMPLNAPCFGHYSIRDSDEQKLLEWLNKEADA